MTKEELFKAQGLYETIRGNEKQLEVLKKDLANFKKEITYPIMTFEMFNMIINVYRDDVVKCMEEQIVEYENKIKEQLEKFNQL